MTDLEHLENIARTVGRLIETSISRSFGINVGFAFLLFDFGNDGNLVTCFSNTERQAMITALQKTIDFLRSRDESPISLARGK